MGPNEFLTKKNKRISNRLQLHSKFLFFLSFFSFLLSFGKTYRSRYMYVRPISRVALYENGTVDTTWMSYNNRLQAKRVW
jgi:hypothetical protein